MRIDFLPLEYSIAYIIDIESITRLFDWYRKWTLTRQNERYVIFALKVEVKESIVLREIHLRTTGLHLSMGSHRLPRDRSDRPAFTPPGQIGTRFIDPVKMKGWVGLVGWLTYIPKWFTRPQTVTHPGTNWVWRSVTTLIEANALPLSQTANYTIVVTQWFLSSVTLDTEI